MNLTGQEFPNCMAFHKIKIEFYKVIIYIYYVLKLIFPQLCSS